MVETSASFEARSAPPSYSTRGGEIRNGHSYSDRRREADASYSICLADLKAPIGGSFCVGQTTPNGWFPPLNKRPFLFVVLYCQDSSPCGQTHTLSSSGVARRAMTLSYVSLVLEQFLQHGFPA